VGEGTASLGGFDIAAKGDFEPVTWPYEQMPTEGEKLVGSSYHSVSLFCALGIGEGGNATADIIVKHVEFLAVLRNEDPKLLDQFLNAINVNES